MPKDITYRVCKCGHSLSYHTHTLNRGAWMVECALCKCVVDARELMVTFDRAVGCAHTESGCLATTRCIDRCAVLTSAASPAFIPEDYFAKTMHDSSGKLGLHKIPYEMLESLAQVMDYGDNKYAPGNWKKGTNWLEFFGSTLRHLYKWRQGEDVDPESGCLHLAHAICNLTFLIWYSKHVRGHDDRLDDREYKIDWLSNATGD